MKFRCMNVSLGDEKVDSGSTSTPTPRGGEDEALLKEGEEEEELAPTSPLNSEDVAAS